MSLREDKERERERQRKERDREILPEIFQQLGRVLLKTWMNY